MDQDKHRSYNEKEIGALIQRATELHEEALGTSERNLSLEEIEHIAAELGVPPEYMRTAALELEDRVDSNKVSSLFGGPFVIDQSRVVDGTMTEEQWGDIVLELQRFSGGTGKISEVGRARQWMYYKGEGDGGVNLTKTRVTVRPGEDQTSIQIQKHYGGMAIPLYLVVFGLSIFLSLFMLNEFPNPLTLVLDIVGIIGALAGVRTLLSSWSRRQEDKLKQLTHRIQQTVSTHPPQILTDEPTSTRIELPEMDEPEQAATKTGRGVRV